MDWPKTSGHYTLHPSRWVGLHLMETWSLQSTYPTEPSSQFVLSYERYVLQVFQFDDTDRFQRALHHYMSS